MLAIWAVTRLDFCGLIVPKVLHFPYYVFTKTQPPVLIYWLALLLNINCVIASIIIFEFNYASLTAAGRTLILAQAASVLGFVILEIIGVWAIGRQRLAAA